MNKHIQELKKFLLDKGIDEKEVVPYLEKIEKNMKNKKYGLIWEEQEENILAELKGKFPILNEVKEREIITSEEKSMNLLIEGDNLESLYVLNYTHKGLISLIYIDPPYNLGGDFIYNDKIVDKEDEWRHSKWLSFMNKRLRLAKELLSDKGLIFISIDDNEVAQLKLLMDEIFGEGNLLGILPTIMNLKGNQDQFGFAGTHEYTLVYAKNKALCKINEFDVDENEILEKWEKDDFGLYKKGANIRATGTDAPREKRTRMYYPILHKNNELSTITEEEYSKICNHETKEFDDEYVESLRIKYENMGYDFILPINNRGQKVRWRWGWSNKTKEKLKKEVIISKTKNGITIYKKQRPELGDVPSRKPKSTFYKPEYSSGNGTEQLESMFDGRKVFDNPKPIQLIKDIIKIGSDKDDIIVDFFAGSGTAGQAVIETNIENGTNRKFILCTNNENNICEDITYQRLFKVINGYTNPDGEEIEGLGGNLKYYKTNLIEDKVDTHENIQNLIDKCTSLIQIKENCYNLTESNDLYDIITNNNNKIAVIIKNPFIWNHEIDEILDTIEIDKNGLILYTTKSDYSKEGIITKEFPQHIVDQYNRLRKTM